MAIHITVRDATASDMEAIIQYNQRLAEETEGKALDPRVISAGVRRGFNSPEMCRYFVAEVNGAVVGTTPSRTLPVQVPPCRSHNARKTAAK